MRPPIFIKCNFSQGIETNNTASMTEALKKNERVYYNIESTIADGLAVNMVGVNTFHTIKGLVDKVVKIRLQQVFSIAFK